MACYEIKGAASLKGEIRIQGSKNAVLPLIAASLLNKGTTVLHNCPDISDVNQMLGILTHIGCDVKKSADSVTINSAHFNAYRLPDEKVRCVRASVLMLGALLARTGNVIMEYPGGCHIGKRPVDYHLNAFKELGAVVDEYDNVIKCSCTKLYGKTIRLPFPSVGATENVILAATGANGTTMIENAALEPEIDELCQFINSMGASVKGIGTDVITIKGGCSLHDTEWCVSSDRIVAGTYACAAAITGGDICCRMNSVKELESVINILKKTGCEIYYGNDYLRIAAADRLNSIDLLQTTPYPGFPTDMQSQLMSVLAIADGRSIIEENVFENRFQIVDELIKMGADIRVEGNRAYINGVKAFKGARVKAHELRGGAALVIAGLGADGITYVEDTGYIKRGYEDIVGNITLLGGNIQLV